jgi:hypothetical protein
MASLNSYIVLVENFYNKYKKYLGEKTKNSISDVLNWVSQYPKRMNQGLPAHDRIVYLRRGASLLERFAEIYVENKEVLTDQILTCHFELLKTGKCTRETLSNLKKFTKDYTQFMYDFIGCAEKTSDMVLFVLQNAYNHLGEEFKQKVNRIEDRCMEARMYILNPY